MLQINPLRIVDVLCRYVWTKSCKACGGREPSVDKKNLQEVPVLAARLRADGDFSVVSVPTVLTFKTN